MCNCSGMCRDPASELEGREWIPLSNHHPRCEDYKVNHYAKIQYCDSGGFITEFDMVDDTISQWLEDGDSPEDYSVSSIILTKDQFENLPEFDGF